MKSSLSQELHENSLFTPKLSWSLIIYDYPIAYRFFPFIEDVNFKSVAFSA